MAQTFGEWIKETRQERGWTIQRCAENAGIRWQVWSRLEHDEPHPKSGKPPQRRRETVAAVAKGLDVDIAQAFAAAGFRNPAIADGKALPGGDTLLLEAIALLAPDDKQALQTLVTHLNARSRVPEGTLAREEAEALDKPLPVASLETSRRMGPRTIGIDLDAGYLRDPEGRVLSEAQLPQIAELVGQLAAIYTRSQYALSEADTILSQMRQELRLPELPGVDNEEMSQNATEEAVRHISDAHS